jgi:chromodomain-helicase-DNA-binding protein 4
MNFLDPEEWSDLEALEKEHEALDEELLKQLHERLRPYFLRRTKKEVLKLPPKNEVIVPVSMAPLQKDVYKSILSGNYDLLRRLNKDTRLSTSLASLKNMLMQLRKCLQHPYLVSAEIEPQGLSDKEAHEKLVEASTKINFLRLLLPQLKARGHRVLLFSQFVIALDILEDFLKGEGIKYLRLDGSTQQRARQEGIDEFNREGSDVFLYMLTTRAGGAGINLWTADTVISAVFSFLAMYTRN